MVAIRAWIKEYRSYGESQDNAKTEPVGLAESDDWPRTTQIDIVANVDSVVLHDETRVYKIVNASGALLHFKVGATAATAASPALVDGQTESEGVTKQSGVTVSFFAA